MNNKSKMAKVNKIVKKNSYSIFQAQFKWENIVYETFIYGSIFLRHHRCFSTYYEHSAVINFVKLACGWCCRSLASFSVVTNGKKSGLSLKNVCECTYLANIKNRLRGHWKVSGSISRIDGTKEYHGDCLHHLEGLIRLMMPCATYFPPEELQPFCCGLWHST